MYYLSILLDNRKYHIVTLFPEKVSRHAGQPVSTFIVQRNTGEGKLLFSVHSAAKVVSRGGFTQDKEIDWDHVHMDLRGDQLVFEPGLISKVKPAENTVKPVSDLLRYQADDEGKKHSVLLSGNYVGERIRVTVGVKVDGERYCGAFDLHLVREEHIYDVVMDFGSEASQVVMHKRKGSGNEVLRRTPIVNKLVKHHYPDLKGADLHQRGSADGELYRSQFFIRRSEAVFDPTLPAGNFKDDELLNLLTERKDIYKLAETHLFVSNLKLAHLGAFAQEIGFKSADSNIYNARQKHFDEVILDLQQAVINYFIQTLLSDLRDGNKQGSKLYLSIRLLVPNVFDQQKVSLLASKTSQSLERISGKNPDTNLAGWEVNTISESDASFLGFKREKEEESRKNKTPYWVSDRDYLIIDAGKGTIDFSILGLSDQYQLSSIFRSGFIGAGNVVSYAFVDTVFSALFGKSVESRQKSIFHVCLAPHVGMVAKIAFTEVIEKLKQNYDPAKSGRYKSLEEVIPAGLLSDIRKEYQNNPRATTLLGQIAEALQGVVEVQGSLRDEFQLILDTTNALVERISEEVLYSGFYDKNRLEKIIITGRGFKFSLLEKAIAQKFGRPVDTTSDLKKICLLGAFSADRINFDSNLVGYPTLYQFVTTPAGQRILEINQGGDKPVSKIPISNEFFRKTSEFFGAVGEGYKKWASKLEGGSDFAEDGLIAERDKKLTDREKLFLSGIQYDAYNRDTQTIAICGLDYKKHNIAYGPINIFYTGSEFIVRNQHDYSPLGVYPRFFEETQWVFQTLYPFSRVEDASGVKVLKAFEDELDLDDF